jgi:hypothetical protein
VPTVDEQERIAALLGAADAAATSAAEVARHATAARVALVSELLTGAHTIPPSYDAILQAAGDDRIEAA